IVKLAKQNNKTIRCAAQGHCVSSLSCTDNYLVIVTDLNQVTVQEDPKYGWTVTAEAGTQLLKLDDVLRNHNPPLTLDSETVYDTFRVSGVISVGAHGAKTSSGIMSDQVCSMKIVTASGDVVEFSEEIDKSEFNAAKVNLGLLGIIYSVTFRVQPMYNLRMTDALYRANEWLKPQNIKNLLESSDGIEIYYFPLSGGFNPKASNPLDLNPDTLLVLNWERTNDSVTLPPQVLEQTRQTEVGEINNQYLTIPSYLTSNPSLTPSITGTLSNVNNGG
ncbi:4806_t:CDS:2, partial [Dentiscutata erythropus]